MKFTRAIARTHAGPDLGDVGRVVILHHARASVLTLALAGCSREPAPVTPTSELPPLPPSSGTPVGYLLDHSGELALSTDQVDKLRTIDTSLAARNDGIDTQLREIERPQEEAPPDKNAPPPPPPNRAPGAEPVHTTPDAAKLHEARAANSKDAHARRNSHST